MTIEALAPHAFKEGNPGRQKGALNKTTVERNNMLREKLLKTNVIFRAIDELDRRLTEAPESVRTSEIVNVITKVGAFLYQTVSEETQELIITEFTNRDQAVEGLDKLKEAVTLLRAVK